VPFDRLLEIVDAMFPQRLQRLQRFRNGPAGVGVHADDDPLPDRFADQPEMDCILLPSIRMSGLDAQHPYAELMERPLGVADHLLGVGRYADRPLEGDTRLRQTADQIIDRLTDRLAHRVVERGVQRGAGHVVRGGQAVEQSMNALDVEDPLSDQTRPPDLPDQRDHGGVGVGHRVMWRERPDLTSADDAFGKERDEDGLAEERTGRASIVGSGRSLALQPGLQVGDPNFDAFDAHVTRARGRAFRALAASQRPRRRRGSSAPGRGDRAAQPGNLPRRQCPAPENRS
jgi:hypothetical protein